MVLKRFEAPPSLSRVNTWLSESDPQRNWSSVISPPNSCSNSSSTSSNIDRCTGLLAYYHKQRQRENSWGSDIGARDNSVKSISGGIQKFSFDREKLYNLKEDQPLIRLHSYSTFENKRNTPNSTPKRLSRIISRTNSLDVNLQSKEHKEVKEYELQVEPITTDFINQRTNSLSFRENVNSVKYSMGQSSDPVICKTSVINIAEVNAIRKIPEKQQDLSILVEPLPLSSHVLTVSPRPTRPVSTIPVIYSSSSPVLSKRSSNNNLDATCHSNASNTSSSSNYSYPAVFVPTATRDSISRDHAKYNFDVSNHSFHSDNSSPNYFTPAVEREAAAKEIYVMRDGRRNHIYQLIKRESESKI